MIGEQLRPGDARGIRGERLGRAGFLSAFRAAVLRSGGGSGGELKSWPLPTTLQLPNSSTVVPSSPEATAIFTLRPRQQASADQSMRIGTHGRSLARESIPSVKRIHEPMRAEGMVPVVAKALADQLAAAGLQVPAP